MVYTLLGNFRIMAKSLECEMKVKVKAPQGVLEEYAMDDNCERFATNVGKCTLPRRFMSKSLERKKLINVTRSQCLLEYA